MAKIQTGNQLGVAILQAVGISPKHVLDVELVMKPCEVAALRVTVAVPDNVTGALCTILDEYELVFKPKFEGDCPSTAVHT